MYRRVVAISLIKIKSENNFNAAKQNPCEDYN